MESVSTPMLELPDRTEPDCESDINIDDNDVEESTGWDDSTELDIYIKNKDVDRKLIKKIVRDANRLVPLSSVIFKYGINWIVSDNPSGWTHKCQCPFPDHKDDTPSFGYNTKDDRFNCYGCQKNGNAVQFLAFLQRKNIPDVAKELLYRFKAPEEIIAELDDGESDKSDEIILQFSNDIREFLYENIDNPKALEYAEGLMWTLDVYLEKHVLRGTVKFESVQGRIEKLREHLKVFGK